MENIPETIATTARLLFERKLLDMSGGNLSARTGNTIYISPRYSGSRRHWQLQPEDIVCSEMDSAELLNDPRLSREAKAHLAIYASFPDVNAVVHAHPFHILPFIAAGKPIRPVLEQTEKFGVIDVVPAAQAHSAKLAENVVAGLCGKEEIIRKQAAAVILPRHGIIVAGKDLLAAADALERIDWNAYCILAMHFLN